MNRLCVVVFAVSTAWVTVLHLVESAENPPQHKLEISDDLFDDKDDSQVRNGAVGQASAMANVNNRPLKQLMPTSVRPGLARIPIDVVECYVCTDCQKVYENTTSKFCPHTLDVTRQNKCVTYAEQYKHMKRPWHIRGCASERGSCDDIRKAHSTHADIVNLLYCRECEGERCNTSGGYRSLADTTMSLLAVIVTPVIAKYTLS